MNRSDMKELVDKDFVRKAITKLGQADIIAMMMEFIGSLLVFLGRI